MEVGKDEGFDLTLSFNVANVKDNYEEVSNRLASVKTTLLGAPFLFAFQGTSFPSPCFPLVLPFSLH